MNAPVYEMLWDCKFCNAQKLLGLTHRHCPNCGAQQDANARYFPPDSERIAVSDHVYVGADIRCRYCQSATSRAAHNCGNCGAPLAEGQAVQPLAGAPQALLGAPVAPPKKRSRWILLAPLLVLMLAACGAVAGLLFWKQQAAFTVTGYEWKRSVTVEAFGPASDSAWCDQLPAGASDVRKQRQQRSTKRVPDGEDCHARKVDNGDGTFHEKQDCSPKFKEEPVFDDKCEFRVVRWATARIEKATGSDAAKVRWPDVKLAQAGSCVGCERQGARSESYTVVFKDPKGELFRCDFPEAKWTTFAAGSRWNGALRRLVGTLDCDSLTKR